MTTRPMEHLVGCPIRATHWAAYKSGEWGKVLDVVEVNGRYCYRVGFNDETWDDWPIVDPLAGYEFGGRVSPDAD